MTSPASRRHPNEDSELDVDPEEGEERHPIDEFVPDGLNDESNVEDPADDIAADEALRRIADRDVA